MPRLRKFGFTDLKVNRLKTTEIELYAYLSGVEIFRTGEVEGKLRDKAKRIIEANPWEDLEGRKVFEFERLKRGEWRVRRLLELKEGFVDLEVLKAVRGKDSRHFLLYLFGQLSAPTDGGKVEVERLIKTFGIKREALGLYLKRISGDINEKTPFGLEFRKERGGGEVFYTVRFKDKALSALGEKRRELDFERFNPESEFVRGVWERLKRTKTVPPFEVQRKIASLFGRPEFTFLVGLWSLSVGNLDKELYFYETVNSFNPNEVKSIAYFDPIFRKDFELVRTHQREFRSLANKVFGVLFPEGTAFIYKTLEGGLIRFSQNGIWSKSDSASFKLRIGYNFLSSLPLSLLTLSELSLLFNTLKGKCLTKGIKLNSLVDLKLKEGKDERVSDRTLAP